jgi:hypothetical protein
VPLTSAYVGNARFRAHVNSLGISVIQGPTFVPITQIISISAETQEALEIDLSLSRALGEPSFFPPRMVASPSSCCVLLADRSPQAPGEVRSGAAFASD